MMREVNAQLKTSAGGFQRSVSSVREESWDNRIGKVEVMEEYDFKSYK